MDTFAMMAGTLAVLAAFFIGLFTGLVVREKPLLPVEPAKPDRIKQMEYEADQQALLDCLNYSIDVAYKNGE